MRPIGRCSFETRNSQTYILWKKKTNYPQVDSGIKITAPPLVVTVAIRGKYTPPTGNATLGFD